jgi:hypothetical protein
MAFTPTNGLLLIAYNNITINYGKLAILAAKQAKKYMNNIHVTLMTDEQTYKELLNGEYKNLKSAFDNVIVENIEHETNIRSHFDSPWLQFNAQFSNKNKHSIFEKSPYDKTLMIDVDYLIGNDSLLNIFDTNYGLALFKNAMSARNHSPRMQEQKLNEHGIDMWWSTVVYWEKNSPEAQIFFNVWEHVKENYNYYKFLYKFPGALYRTDFAASIAIHLLNGQTGNIVVNQLPGKIMRYSDQMDTIVKVHDNNDIVLQCPIPLTPWKCTVNRIKKENIHFMNKMNLLNYWEEMIGMIDQ